MGRKKRQVELPRVTAGARDKLQSHFRLDSESMICIGMASFKNSSLNRRYVI